MQGGDIDGNSWCWIRACYLLWDCDVSPRTESKWEANKGIRRMEGGGSGKGDLRGIDEEDLQRGCADGCWKLQANTGCQWRCIVELQSNFSSRNKITFTSKIITYWFITLINLRGWGLHIYLFIYWPDLVPQHWILMCTVRLVRGFVCCWVIVIIPVWAIILIISYQHPLIQMSACEAQPSLIQSFITN